MSVEILVDFREATLLEKLQEYVETHHIPVHIVNKNLEVGDVIIQQNDTNLSLVFERKTIADLAASIKDGRYKEQKYRLLSTYTPHHVTYIIEGGRTFMSDKHGISASTFEGAFMNTMYRDGVHVLCVTDVDDTARWIANLARRCVDNPGKFSGIEQKGGYHNQCKAKTRKIENITPQSCFIMQLCQIPGVSQKIAENIAQVYPSLRCFIEKLTSLPDPVKELCKITLVGSKKANIIVEFMLATHLNQSP